MSNAFHQGAVYLRSVNLSHKISCIKLVTSLKIIKILSTLVLFALMGANTCMANDDIPREVSKHVPNASLVGEGMFTFYFWDVYRASLYAPNRNYDHATPFALRLTYQRELEGKKIAQRSIDEMLKQQPLSKNVAEQWLSKMESIFPNVTEGDVLTGVAISEEETQFYFNGEYIDTIQDSNFTSRFFDIWLGEKTSEPKFRKLLLGK